MPDIPATFARGKNAQLRASVRCQSARTETQRQTTAENPETCFTYPHSRWTFATAVLCSAKRKITSRKAFSSPTQLRSFVSLRLASPANEEPTGGRPIAKRSSWADALGETEPLAAAGLNPIR